MNDCWFMILDGLYPKFLGDPVGKNGTLWL